MIRHSTPSLLKKLEFELLHLPSPSNLTYLWNFGSLLGLCLLLQITTGLLLSMHYSSSTDLAFDSIEHIMINVKEGWLIRSAHANGASAMFLFAYLHITRGLYFGSFHTPLPWLSGVLILLLMMLTAFLGYVLPWGQMSYWGATVITNLLSAVPYVGTTFVEWLWGGYSVSNPTLMRFYSIHFISPFILLAVVVAHLFFIHELGSSNPLGTLEDTDKVFFHPVYTSKDLLGYLVFSLAFCFLILEWPQLLLDPVNFSESNPLSTPIHIQPEWYFLFAYTILRVMPTKLGGVVALLFSVAILALLPLKGRLFVPSRFSPFRKGMIIFHSMNFTLLTWLGTMPVDQPFIFVGQASSMFYFIFYILL
nr:cytochrome b [Antarctophthirus carlinii]